VVVGASHRRADLSHEAKSSGAIITSEATGHPAVRQRHRNGLMTSKGIRPENAIPAYISSSFSN
jgi:hypothetical protein